MQTPPPTPGRFPHPQTCAGGYPARISRSRRSSTRSSQFRPIAAHRARTSSTVGGASAYHGTGWWGRGAALCSGTGLIVQRDLAVWARWAGARSDGVTRASDLVCREADLLISSLQLPLDMQSWSFQDCVLCGNLLGAIKRERSGGTFPRPFKLRFRLDRRRRVPSA